MYADIIPECIGIRNEHECKLVVADLYGEMLNISCYRC